MLVALRNTLRKQPVPSSSLYAKSRHPYCSRRLSHPKDENIEHLGFPVCCVQTTTLLVLIVPQCKFIHVSAMCSTSKPMCQHVRPLYNHVRINNICGKHATASASRHMCNNLTIVRQGRAIGDLSGGAAASAGTSASASTTLSDGSCVVRRKVDDDNSCLFSAVAYVMQGSRSHAAKLR